MRAAVWPALISIFLLLASAIVAPLSALVIELDDVAPDRIERQRAFTRGTLPPSNAPDLSDLAVRLAEQGLAEGAPIMLRLFKAESELELWMRKGNAFVLQGTYPICHWTGTLGPKLREGDKQSPEGFYAIGSRQMRHLGRWREAFNLGFPNLHDKRLGRTGSYILIHGGCSSTGCYAMTEKAQKVIHRLAASALRGRQEYFQVHIFPFRMTDANMAAHAESPWVDFWRDLKAGYDAFEETRLPPRIGVCRQRYVVAKASPAARGDGKLTQVDPGKLNAAGFDVSRCDIPVVDPTEVVAAIPSTSPDGDPARSSEATNAPSPERAVARVERRESVTAPLPSSSADRTNYGRRGWALNKQRQRPRTWAASRERKQAQMREQLRKKRRAHRETFGESYRRALLGATQ
jgi:murein L,D-transpeptidase YafK